MSNNLANDHISGINCSIIVSQLFSVACIFAYSMTIILPIMLVLCLMLSGTYYAQNFASIIGWCLTRAHAQSLWELCFNFILYLTDDLT